MKTQSVEVPMPINPLLITAITITGAIAVWGIVDNAGLASIAASAVKAQLTSRAWFIMASVSFLLFTAIFLAFSRFGSIRLGADDDRPEFSTVSWLTMLFAAGMGVGLLYYGTAEPLTHYLFISDYVPNREAAALALSVTLFNWGFHAWAIYALTGLVIAYFSFRLNCPTLISAPIVKVFGSTRWTKSIGWVCDLLSIVAIAIGLGGSIAMGVFQIKEGIDALFDLTQSGQSLTLSIFAMLCIAYALPLTVDLSRGMAVLSNAAMAIAGFLLIFVLLAGPTHYVMDGVLQAFGDYVTGAIKQGFQTFPFMDAKVGEWFQSWTLNYMVWWIAWAPFVGVFIARISKGRTIREFILGVIVVPTLFSIVWFSVFGSIGFHTALSETESILQMVKDNASGVTFYILQQFPLASLMIAAVIVAAFLFLITSVVSASFVLGMFSTQGDLNPNTSVKIAWGIIIGALGLVMILSGSIPAVRSIIALGALPFVFVVLLLVTCLLIALKIEKRNEQ